ncbi:MAG: AcrR family transcriptional regulator [Verrucomicrobiales bacterium]|jgi:AcrR family transcriptional regulator
MRLCKRSARARGANPALISYHFGDKASLYEAVWRHCVARARKHYPVDGGVDERAPVEERIRAHICSFVRCMADSGELSYLHRLNLMESAAPNRFISSVIQELRQPHTEYLWDLLGELLGPDATEQDIGHCEASVVGQCRMARAGRGTRNPDLTTPLSSDETQSLAEHIVTFTLAGIGAMRREINQRKS